MYQFDETKAGGQYGLAGPLTDGAELPRGENARDSDDIYRCQFINLGTVPVVNVSVDFQTSFHTIVRTSPNSFSPGKETLSRGWTVEIPRLEAGDGQRLVMYLKTGTQDRWMTVTAPKKARYRLPNETEDKDVTLMQTSLVGRDTMTFSPRGEKGVHPN